MLSPLCFSFAPKPQGPTERSEGSISEVIFSGLASDFCPPFSSMKMGCTHTNAMKHLTKMLGEQVKTAWWGAGVAAKAPGMLLGLRRCSDKVWGYSPETTRTWFALYFPRGPLPPAPQVPPPQLWHKRGPCSWQSLSQCYPLLGHHFHQGFSRAVNCSTT